MCRSRHGVFIEKMAAAGMGMDVQKPGAGIKAFRIKHVGIVWYLYRRPLADGLDPAIAQQYGGVWQVVIVQDQCGVGDG
jgi:hypothetical protein